MNILLINSLYSPNQIGGAERSVQDLAETLVKLNHKVSVICLAKEASMDIVNGVNVYYLKLNNIHWPFGEKHNVLAKFIWHIVDLYNPAMAKAVRKIIDRETPDVVHTNNLAGFSVAIWREISKHKIPIVHTVRDMYLLCERSSMFKKNRTCSYQCSSCRLLSSIKSVVNYEVNHVVGISHFILQTHQRFGFFKKTSSSVISNSYQAVMEDSRNNKTGLQIGYMGRLSPAKGVSLLIDSYVSSALYSHSDLLLAGEGYESYVKELMKKVSGSRIRFMGHVSPGDFFPKIDILIVPSLWEEPFGRVVIEAYAHGVPVIASNRGGIPEIIDEGETGFIFDPEDSSALTKVLERFQANTDIVQKMRLACIKKAKYFLPEYIAKKYVKVYADVVSDGREAV